MLELHEMITSKGGVGKTKVAAELLVQPKLNENKKLYVRDFDPFNSDLYSMTKDIPNIDSQVIYSTKNIQRFKDINNTDDIDTTVVEDEQVQMYDDAYVNLDRDYICDNGAGNNSIDKLKYLFLNGSAYRFLEHNYIIYINIVITSSTMDSIARDILKVYKYIKYYQTEHVKGTELEDAAKKNIKVNLWKNEIVGRNFTYRKIIDNQAKYLKLEEFSSFQKLKDDNLIHGVYRIIRESSMQRLDLMTEAFKYKKLLTTMAEDKYIEFNMKHNYLQISKMLIKSTYENAEYYDKPKE